MTRVAFVKDPSSSLEHAPLTKVRVQRERIPTSRQKLAKPVRIRINAHLKFVREHPCRVCVSGHPAPEGHGWGTKTEAAHVDVDGRKGLGTKAPDIWALDLCGYHHRADGAGLDKIPRDEFEARYEIDVNRELLILNAEFLETEG